MKSPTGWKLKVRSSRILKMKIKQFCEEMLCGKSDTFKKHGGYIKVWETKMTYRKA